MAIPTGRLGRGFLCVRRVTELLSWRPRTRRPVGSRGSRHSAGGQDHLLAVRLRRPRERAAPCPGHPGARAESEPGRVRGWRGDRITAPGPAPGAGRDGCAGSRGADAQGVPAYCCCRARATASRGSRRGRWWGPRERKPHNVREPVFSDPEPGTYGCMRHCRRVSRVTVTGPPPSGRRARRSRRPPPTARCSSRENSLRRPGGHR